MFVSYSLKCAKSYKKTFENICTGHQKYTNCRTALSMVLDSDNIQILLLNYYLLGKAKFVEILQNCVLGFIGL